MIYTTELQQLEHRWLVYHGLFELISESLENKYWGKFSYFIMKLYVTSTHSNRLIEAI